MLHPTELLNFLNELIARYEGNQFIVSTVSNFDQRMPYETAIADSHYRDGWIQVEQYRTREDAVEGHVRWVETMEFGPPQQLVETGSFFSARRLDKKHGNKNWRTFKRKGESSGRQAE